jgi:hypothetical protein
MRRNGRLEQTAIKIDIIMDKSKIINDKEVHA